MLSQTPREQHQRETRGCRSGLQLLLILLQELRVPAGSSGKDWKKTGGRGGSVMSPGVTGMPQLPAAPPARCQPRLAFVPLAVALNRSAFNFPS